MNKSFCIKPFTEICNTAQNGLKLCCESEVVSNTKNLSYQEEFFYNKTLNKVRKKMLKGEPVEYCKNCYDWESQGLSSMRTDVNSELMKNNFELYNKVTNGHLEIISLDIKFGNRCNLACVMCDSGSSSLIAQENKKYKNEFGHLSMNEGTEIYDFDLNNINELLELAPNLIEIKSTGGEPMLLPGFKTFLEKLVASGDSKHIDFRIVTNSTVDSTNLIELMKEFKTFKIFWSVDGIDEAYDWVRWPANFKRVSRIHNNVFEKIKTLDVKNVIIQLSSCISVVNFDQVIPINEYWYNLNKEYKLNQFDRINFNLVRDPEIMQVGLAPLIDIKNVAKQIINYCNLKQIKSYSEGPREIAAMMLSNSKKISENLEYKEKLLEELFRQCQYWRQYRGLKSEDRWTIFNTLRQIKS